MKRATMGPAMIYLLMVGIFSPAIVESVMFGTTGTRLHTNDDGYSSAQSISNFPFFGNIQTRLFVCTNGIISFGSGIASFTPTPFPIANNPVVAPFWGDVDTNRGGDIYYRAASAGDRGTLTAAIGVAGFVATSGYIVSWVNVAAYGGGGPRNTFQAALATDGTSSFVIFNYQSVHWTYGSASRGTPAQAGFDAGDGRNSYAHEWSRTASINRLPSSSNVGVNGRYIYGVGALVIVPVDEVVVDLCADVNCQNGGTCNDGNCNCRTGYEGSRCESVINWCSRNGINCNNHGTCSNRADNTGWQCSCRHVGYSGTQCEVVRDWCLYSNINCYGRGTCSNTNDNDNWQCACIHNGYYGTQCENIRDWCSDQGQTCSSHGTCSNSPNNDWWVCSCRHSVYYGTECEHIVDWCTIENEDCNGNGVCSNEPDNAHWVCACYEGFIGTDCDDQLCFGGIYCHNNGVCGPEGCQCVSPYAGDDCQTVNPACTGVDCGYGLCTGNGQCSCFSGYAQLSSTSPCTGQVCGGRVCYNGGSCVGGACVCAVGWLEDTCQEEDLCHGATCNSHGECVVYNGAPVCRCDDLSFGPESGPIEDHCSQQTCSNGYVCHNGGLCNANGGCDCVYPYNGASCTGTNYCSGIDCGYGTCSQSGQGFECACSSTDVWVDPYTRLCTTTVCAGNQLFCRNTATCQSGPTCSCPGGYYGENCEDWDACYEVTCLNGATCRDNQHNAGDYLCECADGYHGRHCELQRCTDQVTCYNGGQCSDTGCICPVEWTGPSCQESVPSFCQHYYCGVGGTCTGDSSPVCVCESGYQQSAPSEICNLICADLNCQNGGVCDATAPVCQCPPGYYGETCGLTSPCGAVECHHARGTCGDYQGDLASCQCVLPIYTGDDCSTELCSSGPQSQCLNGGSCTSSSCECPYPYEGSQCQTLNYCPSGNCGHGSCQSGGDGAVCTCDSGYIQDERTGRCTTEYLCADGVHFCMHNGECNGAGDGCNCVDGYTGRNCEEIDLCAGVDCNNGFCIIQPESVPDIPYICSCDEGWVGGHCDIRRCTNSLICQNGAVCSEDGCTCTPGWTGNDCTIPLDPACYTATENRDCGHGSCGTGGVCNCDSEWIRDSSGSCTIQSCGGVQCQNGATCLDNQCDCPPNYLGEDCSNAACLNIDCGANGFCQLMNDGSNKCICVDLRWSGEYCQNELCSDGFPCQHGGSCVAGASPCACTQGFSGTHCENVDHCAGVVCSHGTCVVDNNAAFCRCDTGYVIDPISSLCTQQLCTDGNQFCLNDQPCAGPSSCACSPPYSGTNCEIVDYCYENTCNVHGECRLAVDHAGNSLHRHECVCEDGYHGSDCQYEFCIDNIVCFNGGTCRSTGCECTAEWQGPSCEVPMPPACSQQCENGECDSSGTCLCYEGYRVGPTGICDTNTPQEGVCQGTTCYNGGTCTEVENLLTSEIEPVCVCNAGWTGDDCGTYDACSLYDCSGNGECVMYQDTTPRCVCFHERWRDSTGGTLDCDLEACSDGSFCRNGGSCVAGGGCTCPYPYEGNACDIENVCPSQQCHHGFCTPGTGDFAWDCDCYPGYIYNEITGYCDSMLCADHVKFCQNGGTCVDGATTSTCTCLSGVSGDNCEIVDHCHNIDCHSGNCENLPTDYQCNCLQGFSGTHCELQDCLGDLTCFHDGICGQDGCLCTDLWEGPTCEQRRTIPCEGVDCSNGQCLQAGSGYECQCETGYSQDSLSSPCYAAVCTTTICQNGGTCLPPAVNDPERCQCMPGYLGDTCEIITCAHVDCHDHGVCVVLPNGAGQCVCDHSRWSHTDGPDATPGDCSLEVLNGVTCQNGGSCVDFCMASPPCECPWPFVGTNCETSSPCDPSLDTCVHGTCYAETRDGRDFWCYCDEGYIPDSDSGFCVTELCDVSFCQHGGTCNADQLSCTCPPGISGDHCEIVDHCYGHDCSGNGYCEVLNGDEYHCYCNDGWIGTGCELQRCIDGVTCFNGGSCRFDGCNCQPGWGGLSCEIPLALECYEPQVYNCSHGYCVVQNNGELGCECYEGYSVDPTDTPVRCSVHTDGELSCQHGGTVGMVDGEARCMCTDDYIGDNCEIRSPCADFECAANARCILDENNNPSCACAHSRWSGLRCEIVTCNDNSVCQNGGSCVSNDDESYSCNCPYPYTGARCEVEDYCQDLEQACGHAIRCHPGVVTECENSRRLYYVPDSELTSSLAGSGPENSRLDGDGVWTGAPGEYIKVDLGEVMAVKGVITQGSGSDYVSAFTFAVSRDTRHYEDATMTAQSSTATQNILDTPLIGRYVLLLVTGMVSQPYLQWDVLACPYDDFQCECNFDPNEVTGHYTDQVTGRCTTATCASGDWFCLNDGECMDNDDGSAWCHCPQGTTGEHCETSDLCHQVECSNNGWCESRPHMGDHVCHCKEGWMGADCEMQLCTEGVTCMNGGVCWPLQGCVCPPEFSGSSCEDPIPLRCQGAPETEHGTCIPDEVDWTTTTTGCSCWFDESRTDCACCTAGGCLCDESQPYRCVACGDTEACDLPMEINVFEHDTWQSSTDGDGDSSYAVDRSSPDQDDSDTSTCVQTLYGSEDFRNYRDWFTVDLDGAYRVYYIKIYGVPDQSMSPFTVYLLGDNENPQEAEESLTCKFVDSPLAYISEGATVMCDSPVVGRYLTIDSASDSTPLSFCDIQVFGERPFTIECEHGYTNQDFARHASCDMQICDYATNRTCENGGSCLANNTCACPIGFQGEFCQYTGCDGVFCYDHGRCEMLWNEMPECVCNHDRWSNDDDLATNAPGVGNCALETCESGLVCYNGGSCVSGAAGGYLCSCTYHWMGAACQEPVPCPEAENTCIHGMGCAESTATGHLPTDFTCECENDYIVNPTTGECTTRICDDGFGGEHMCMHLGTCVMLEDGTQGCECPPGIFGANCEHIDHCHEQACGGHGLCMNFTNRYYCACDDGWIGDDCNMQRCDDRYTCFHGARCQADGWNQGCICPQNRFDMMCESFDWCLDVDCGPGGTCQVMDGVDGYNYVCNCAQDWRQEENDRSTPCDNEINYCSVPDWVEHGADFLDYCQFGGECTPNSMFYVYEAFYVNYTADPTYEGDLEGVRIQPENRTVANMSCTCGPDRLGIQCEILNGCHFENCSHHGTCNPNDDGTFNCTCDPRYEGEHCSSHVCSADVNHCHNGGTCSRNGQCTCVYPYTGDSCEETDWCTFAPWWEMDCYHGYCSSREDGFLCVCDNGYIHNQDTGECTTELCNDSEDTFCMNQGTCNDENSNCTCHEEWIDHNCETYNWCWNQTCTLRGDCINFEFDYNCSCFPGFYGRDCELQACYDGVTCRNNSLCSSDGCQCAPGYGGVECDVMMPCEGVDCGYGRCVENITLEFPRQEPIYHTALYYCEIPNNLVNRWAQAPGGHQAPFNVRICAGGDFFCYNEGQCQGDSCMCQDGFYGDDCSVSDPCMPDPCFGHGTCHVNDDATFNCTCAENFQDEDCSVNFCPFTNVLCMNGGTCPHDEFSDQRCWCPFPYTGPTCEEIDYCVDVDCAQGTCDPRNGTCVCQEGWIRDYHTGRCTTSVCNRSNMFCMNNGTCTEAEYTCDCHDWFNYNAWDGGVDVHCEHWNYCFNQTCSNRGFCVNHPDGHTCDCDSGFTGTDCELQLCVDNVVCQNHGLCTPTGCQCTSNYTGNDCSVYDRCGGIECGEGNCVIMPTVEEGCFADMLGDYLTNSVNTGYSFSASSEHSIGLMAQDARTDSGRSWSARSNTADQWLQVDFGNDIIANSWYTLGRGNHPQWVTKYNLSYSLDGSEWRWFRDSRDILFGYRTFDGNTDQHTPVHYSFDEPTLLRYVRFYPVEWHGHISMRVEVEGCRHQPAGYECDCVTNVTGTWHHEVADDITTSCSVQACQHAFSDGSQLECRNFGECLDTTDVANSRFCNCSLGYTGPFCELDDLCINPTDAGNIPMENRACNDRGENCTLEIVGFATATGTYDSHEFTCDCFSPFSGPSCEVDDCNGLYTCENGGSCHPDYDGSCACVYPYEGEHCEEMDYCSGIDCQHGTCETNEAGDGFQCMCNTHNGWVLNLNTGLCTTYYCADGNNFCMNEGYCHEEYEYAEDGDPECLCTDWDRGNNCEDLNQCGPDNACNNRGLCNRNLGVCACSGNQYSGSACETEECRNGEFCYNGGSCRSNGNSCTCSYPYEGSPRCETANWCDGGVSCYEGECQSHDDGFLLPNLRQIGGFNCTCNPGYTHDTSGVTDYHLLNCTTEVCLDNNLCHNTGTCEARGDGTYRCRCSDGYTGDNCELSAEVEPEEEGDDNTAAIAGGAAAGVAGLAAASGLLWGAARRCRRRPEEPEPRAEETDDCSIDDLEDGMGVAPNSMAPQGHVSWL